MKLMPAFWLVAASLVIGNILTIGLAAWRMLQQQMAGLLVDETPRPHDMAATWALSGKNVNGMGRQVPKTYDICQSIRKHNVRDVGPVKVMEMRQPDAAADMLSKDPTKRLAVMMPYGIAGNDEADEQTNFASKNMSLLRQVSSDEASEMLGAVARDDARQQSESKRAVVSKYPQEEVAPSGVRALQPVPTLMWAAKC